MSRSKRAFVAAFVMVLTVFGSVVATGGPAQAAGCSGWGCDGKLPENQGCDQDAVSRDTFYWIPSNEIAFTLRHSPSCKAVWARITDDRTSNYCDSTWRIQIQSRMYDPVAGKYQVVADRTIAQTAQTRCYGHVIWTRMIPQLQYESRYRVWRVEGDVHLTSSPWRNL